MPDRRDIFTIADGIKARLQGQQDSGAWQVPNVSVIRLYLPLFSLTAIAIPQAIVVPRQEEIEPVTRDLMEEQIEFDVALLQILPATVDPSSEAGNTGIDPLMQTMRAIALAYGPKQSAGGDAIDSWWMKTTMKMMYDRPRLKDERTFFGVVTFTFRQFPQQPV